MPVPCDASTYDTGGIRAQLPVIEVDGVHCLDAHELIDGERSAIRSTTRGKKSSVALQLVADAGAHTRALRAETGGDRKL